MKNRVAKRNAVLAAEATTDVAREPASAGYARLMALQNDNIDALARFHAILRDGAVEWSNDLLDFAGRQLQRQSNEENWRVDAATPLAAIASHARQCQAYAERYLEQTARFLNLAAKVSRDSRIHLESHAATMLDHFVRHDGSPAVRESGLSLRSRDLSLRGGDNE